MVVTADQSLSMINDHYQIKVKCQVFLFYFIFLIDKILNTLYFFVYDYYLHAKYDFPEFSYSEYFFKLMEYFHHLRFQGSHLDHP